MLHARADYNRIQDPAGLIPANEPVFLLRAADQAAAGAVRAWATLHDAAGGDPAMSAAARRQAQLMDAWAEKKLADAPDGAFGDAGQDNHAVL